MSVADSRSPNSIVALESALKKVEELISMSAADSWSPSSLEEPSNLQPGVKEAEADGCSQLSPNSFFGLENVLKTIEELVRTGTKRLGIVGMGGIGKTALAMKLFNDWKERFAYSCFTADVKDSKASLEDVILEHVHCGLGQEQLTRLRDLKGKTLLLVLDDVVSDKDLKIVSLLVGDQVHVHSDSLFIATSRNSELLKLWELYSVSLLAPEHSKQLLETLAFPPDKYPVGVPEEYQLDIVEVLKACDGLPLTLETMGRYLYKKPKVIWEQTQQALKKGVEVVGFDEKLWAPLKLTYDRLSKMEQGVFLDAATVYYGKDLDEAKAAWSITTEGSQDMIWQYLADLFLVKEIPPEDESEFFYKGVEIPYDSKEIWNRRIKIGMQEQLRTLGKKIASTGGDHDRRLWETRGGGNEAASKLHLIDNDTHDVKDIVSLKLSLDDLQRANFGGNSSNETSNNKDSKRTPEQNFSIRLREMGNLRYLSLESFKMDPKSDAPLPSTLVSLQLRAAQFTELPFTHRNYKSMAILKLESCTKLKGISEIGQLSSLRVLHISGSEKLNSLDDSLVHLKELRDLKIAGCESLTKLPEMLGNLLKLERVVLEKCEELSCENIDGQSLKTLKIEACKSLPQSLDKLTGLKILVLKDWHNLTDLPIDFGNLAALQYLVLSNCQSLEKWPESLGKWEIKAEVSGDHRL